MFLRAIARPLLSKVKETTGIVGLAVVPNWREVLIDLYTKTLKEVEAIPENQDYRKVVECLCRHRLQACQEEHDWQALEKRLGCGQVEEIIEEARDELTLVGKMIEWDPWDDPEDYEMEVIVDSTPIPKHVPVHRPGPFPEDFHKALAILTASSKKPYPPSEGSSTESEKKE